MKKFMMSILWGAVTLSVVSTVAWVASPFWAEEGETVTQTWDRFVEPWTTAEPDSFIRTFHELRDGGVRQ